MKTNAEKINEIYKVIENVKKEIEDIDNIKTAISRVNNKTEDGCLYQEIIKLNIRRAKLSMYLRKINKVKNDLMTDVIMDIEIQQ